MIRARGVSGTGAARSGWQLLKKTLKHFAELTTPRGSRVWLISHSPRLTAFSKFDSSGKLVSRTDRNENKLTYSSTGITYSHASVSGSTKAVTFTRDGSSRITAIYDPISPSPTGPAAVLYAYDGSGNLSTVQRLVNRASSTYETTTYGYTNASYTHHITQITGSCCSTDVRNEYDSIGRLVRQHDGLGNVSWFAFDLTGRQHYVTNRLGPFQSRFSTSRGFCKAT